MISPKQNKKVAILFNALKAQKKYFFWAYFIFFIGQETTYAQLLLTQEPQSKPTDKKEQELQHKHTYTDLAPMAEAMPRPLPFFDDFSTYKNSLDTTHWLPSGVYLNNTLCLSPPSFNVLSFDGLNARGMPYNFADAFAEGFADTLTSKPIDLSGLSASDSLYLSFFWQSAGLGEAPDDTDSLSIWLKDNTNTWQYVWGQKGGQQVATNQFVQVLLPVKDARFMHAQFQMRFMAKGRLSGPYDVWHIDYVYLNKNRSFNDFALRDVACTRNPSALIKPYTAMPLKHFKTNPAFYSRDTLQTEILNRNNIFNVVSYEATLRELFTNTNLGTLANSFTLINANQRLSYHIPYQPALVPTTGDSAVVEYQFKINAGDNATTIQGYDLRRNDTIIGRTYFTNYLAYDDGTAEYGAGTNQRLARVACRFVIPLADTLTEVQMYIMPMETNLLGQTFVLHIWKRLSNSGDEVLHRQSVPVTYPTQRNQFFTIKLRQPIAVQDTFYIGWQQSTNDVLTIGFDKNTDSGGEIFYNILNSWTPNTQLKGSFMIRPVFGRNIVTQLNRTLTTAPPLVRLYPNPAQDYLQIEAPAIAALSVWNMQGKVLLQKQWQEQDMPNKAVLDLKQWTKGIYVLQLQMPQQPLRTYKFKVE